MKNFTKTLFVAFFACATLFVMSCNPEDVLDSNTDCGDFCDSFELLVEQFGQLVVGDTEDTFTEGDCMSLCNTCNNPSNSVATSANCYCNWVEEVFLEQAGISWEQYSGGEIKNHGQCVKFYKESIATN